MKRASLYSTLLVLTALLLAACGDQGTSTSAPGTNMPSATLEPTSTEMPTGTEAAGTADLTTTPNVPVTGEDSPNRLTNLLGYDVWNQDGEQIGDVNDMVLDFDNSNIAYVVVGTGGFLGLGEKNVLVPWNMLQVQTGDQNAFMYSGDQDAYNNFPELDLSTLLPGTAQPAADWDADTKTYWQNGGIGQATDTPDAGATAQPEMTATAGTENGAATQNVPGAGVQPLQGVILASDLLDSTIQTFDSGTGAIAGQATAAGESNNATAVAGTAVATDTTTGIDTSDSLRAMDMTVDEVIVDPESGDIQYLVVTGAFTAGQRTVPVPVKFLRWDANGQSFSLGVNPIGLTNAPAFEDAQYPDFSSGDWSAQLENYWNNLGPDELVATPMP